MLVMFIFVLKIEDVFFVFTSLAIVFNLNSLISFISNFMFPILKVGKIESLRFVSNYEPNNLHQMSPE